MAVLMPIMPPAAFEVTRTSEFGWHFCSHLMPALAAYIVAERDLDDVAGAYDPAYLQYEQEADNARATLTDAIVENLLVPIAVPTDRPMRRMVMLIDALVRAEDVGTFKGLHRRMHFSFSELFQSHAAGPSAQAVNSVLEDARRMVDALVALPIFERWLDEELSIYHASTFNLLGTESV
ncbi:hypothetical protein [Marivita sp. GX14005]|uniref:hypothetical protein n=1 Tax=Marivita sp. GX14005 TaxID=2942276 RepID=UPI002018766C|nr:hypothetical protein [Marivita sp. GX14005]MCL3882679.1 hypothetical protein [Marivita sp. GX14005]